MPVRASKSVALRQIMSQVPITFATFGFLLQLLFIPSPKTTAQIGADLKAAKLKEKLVRASEVPNRK
jgi:hypothetical protein